MNKIIGKSSLISRQIDEDLTRKLSSKKFPFSHCHCINQSAYKSGCLSLLDCIARITASNLSDCRKNYILQKSFCYKKRKKLPLQFVLLHSRKKDPAPTAPQIFNLKKLLAVALLGLSIKKQMGRQQIRAGPTLHKLLSIHLQSHDTWFIYNTSK